MPASELRYITRTYGRSRTRAVLHLTFHEYAALAEHRLARLEAHGMAPDLIQRAYSCIEPCAPRKLARGLPTRTSRTLASSGNRIARLIELRLRAVRAAARFVFGDHPEIVRQVTSAYRRNQQARWRGKRRE